MTVYVVYVGGPFQCDAHWVLGVFADEAAATMAGRSAGSDWFQVYPMNVGDAYPWDYQPVTQDQTDRAKEWDRKERAKVVAALVERHAEEMKKAIGA